MEEALSDDEALLRVCDLSVAYRAGERELPIARGLNFSMRCGEAVGLLGESGSGKTTTARALMRILPQGAKVRGEVNFGGVDIIAASERALQKIRGAQISFVPQEPLLSLNPVLRVIDQVAAVVRAHNPMSMRECREKAGAVLGQVGLEGERLQRSYPHQLSGGQRGRVLIAQAIVCGPRLVIADEPTRSLDPDSQRAILGLLRDLIHQRGASLLLITHDPSLLMGVADRVMVMYAGRIVESGPTDEVLKAPLHPYTRGLLRCALDDAQAGGRGGDRHVPAIDGSAADFSALPAGCSFEPRCSDRQPRCREAEPAAVLRGSQEVACYLYGNSQ